MNTFGLEFRALIFTCVLQAVVATLAPAQTSVPTVGVVFEIGAGQFKSNMSQAQCASVENEVAETLTHLCGDSVPYLKWQKGNTSPASASLKVVLRSQNAGYGDEIFLQYSSVHNSQTIDWPRDPMMTVYPPFALSLPAHEPDRLKDDILKNLQAEFANDSFRGLLQERLAHNVSLVGSMTFDSTAQRCVLPLPWEALQATDDSVLSASFDAKRPEGATKTPVTFRLAPEHWEDRIKCRVLKFVWPPTSREPPQPDDLPEIAQSLQNKVGNISVYMEKYVRDFRFNTSGPLNLTPGSEK